MNITIKKSDIYTEVAKLAGYGGKKLTDATGDLSYDVMSITTAEEEMLDQFYEAGIDMLTDVLKPFIANISKESDQVTFACDMPDSWDEKLNDSTSGTANQWMTSYISSKWFRITKKEKEEAEAGDADLKMLELRRKIYWKRKPSLPNEEEDNDNAQ